MMRSLREWLDGAARVLASSPEFSEDSGASPRREAEFLLCHALGLTREALVTRARESLPPDAEGELNALLARRAGGEPLAYLAGKREFYGRMFAVSPATLIPRPETEHLVDAARVLSGMPGVSAADMPFPGRLKDALARAPLFPDAEVRFLDLGTGSGCIALTLAAECPCWKGMAVDISEEALDMARINAKALNAADRVNFLHADFTAADFAERLPEEFRSPCLIVSNPPYVGEEEYAGLERGVREFEPKCALVPGPSGLEHPRAVVALAERLLPSGGLLLMEHGAGQGEAARGLCGTAWSLALTGKDYAGLDRYLLAIRGQVRERNIPAAANPCGDTGQEVTTHEPASGI